MVTILGVPYEESLFGHCPGCAKSLATFEDVDEVVVIEHERTGPSRYGIELLHRHVEKRPV
jgi:hypothetical protein